MNFSKNPFVLGALAGSIGTVVKEIFAQAMVRSGSAPYDGIQKSASMVVHPYEIRTQKGFAAGFIMDQAIGASQGALMAILHKKKILKASPVSGTLFGLLTWAAMYGGIGNRVADIGKTTPQGAIIAAGWHMIFGATTGTIIAYMDKHGQSEQPDQGTEKVPK